MGIVLAVKKKNLICMASDSMTISSGGRKQTAEHVMNSYGIFEVDYLRVVRQHKHFSAMGSGEDYALGAMKAVFDLVEDPEEIAKIGIEAAAVFDRKTELPLCTHCIN